PKKPDAAVHTDGGASVGRDVHTGGGDFVGRDKIVQAEDGGVAVGGDISNSTVNINIQQASRGLQRGLHSKLSRDALDKAIRDYLDYIHDRYVYLNLKGMGISDRVPLRLPLLELYVPLKARLELPKGETWERRLTLAGRDLPAEQARLSEPQPVLQILQEHDGVIILGDPGAGKTTFLKYLALNLAHGKGKELGLDGRLPVLLPLSAYANALKENDVRLDAFIARYFAETVGDAPIGQMLGDALKGGRALILLDGLDEVRELALRNTVAERVVDFYAAHRRAGNKFVLTSRVVGYRQVRPTAEGLVECTLVDFDDDEIAAFIKRWTLAIEKQAQGEHAVARRDAETERRELLDAVQRNAGVRRLAANPLLLTILAMMKRQGVTLPERRVQLYDQYVTTLIATWNRARGLGGRASGQDLDDVQTRRLLAPLALWMHRESPGVGLVKRAALHRELTRLLAEMGEAHPEDAARRFLEDVRQFTALLLERGADEYGFIHLTFEEYLAAVGLALQAEGEPEPVVAALAPHVGEQAWREVTLLAVAYIGIIQHMPGKAGQIAEKLAERDTGKPGEAALLAGEAVLDAWPDGVKAESRARILPRLVEAMQNADAAPDVRRRAGLVLGWLGWRPDDLDAFVPVPTGKFLYGDEKEMREIPYRFWMAKYPVTNAQYARFVDDGGYANRRWWSEEGWAWRKKNSRDAPSPWDNHRWNNPIFPVVGVTFYEAEAYTRWLDAQLKEGRLDVANLCEDASALWEALDSGQYCMRLPTETEWEYAARGADGRAYPWGNEFNPAFVNSKESGLRATTAVCTYPQGVSPFGVWDLSGNVWEWTGSWYDKKRRVARGGSWYFDRWAVRAAVRLRLNPFDFNSTNGFRVMLSLAEHPRSPAGA
ncbi:MAG: NACHT domain-containing protein, partial [Caldilineae bacterium]